MPQRKPVPPWLIYMLQVIGLIAVGSAAVLLGPRKAFLDDFVASMLNPTPTVKVDSSKR